MSELMLNLLGAVAQFERALILERQREGIAIAKTKGVYKGRAPSLSPEQVATAKARLEAGEKVAPVARSLGVGRPTLYRHLKLVDKTVDPDLLGRAMAGKQKRRVFGSNE